MNLLFYLLVGVQIACYCAIFYVLDNMFFDSSADKYIDIAVMAIIIANLVGAVYLFWSIKKRRFNWQFFVLSTFLMLFLVELVYFGPNLF